jgi:hypothetical protein
VIGSAGPGGHQSNGDGARRFHTAAASLVFFFTLSITSRIGIDRSAAPLDGKPDPGIAGSTVRDSLRGAIAADSSGASHDFGIFAGS